MKNKITASLMILGAALLLTLTACGKKTSPDPIPVPVETAVLSELKGSVEIRNPQQPDFSPAAESGTLQVQGQVRTGSDGRARLDLSTGTIVRIAPNSQFTLQSNQQEDGGFITRLLMQTGRIWVILKGGQLEVETPSGMAAVRGSFMSVWIDPQTNDIWVACLEGWCQAGNPSGMIELIAAEGTVLYSFDPQGNVPPPPPALRHLSQQDIDDFLANNPEASQVMNAIIATASALPTLTPTFTPTVTPAATQILTSTPTQTPTRTVTPIFTATITPTRTTRPTSSPTVTPTRVPPSTSTPTRTPTVTSSPTSTPTRTSTVTSSPTSTATSSPTSTATSSPTSTVTPTPSPTPKPTSTSTPTISPTPSATTTITPTFSPTPTATGTDTPIPTGTPNQDTVISVVTGPASIVTDIPPLLFQVDASDPQGINELGVLYTIKDSTGGVIGNLDTFEALSQTAISGLWEGRVMGSLLNLPQTGTYTVDWQILAIDGLLNKTSSPVKSFLYTVTAPARHITKYVHPACHPLGAQ